MGTARGPLPGWREDKGLATLQLHRCAFPHRSQPVRIQEPWGAAGEWSGTSPDNHACLYEHMDTHDTQI